MSGMESLEHPEDAVPVFRFDAYTIVCYREGPDAVLGSRFDLDPRRRVWPGKFDGIGDEVLEQLRQLASVTAHCREVLVINLCAVSTRITFIA